MYRLKPSMRILSTRTRLKIFGKSLGAHSAERISPGRLRIRYNGQQTGIIETLTSQVNSTMPFSQHEGLQQAFISEAYTLLNPSGRLTVLTLDPVLAPVLIYGACLSPHLHR